MPVTAATVAPGAAFPLPAGELFGPASDPSEHVHGGFYAAEQPFIKAIQLVLVAGGFAGSVDQSWADGVWEQPTTDAVRAFQRAHGLAQDGLVGPDDWAALFPAPVAPPAPPAPPVVNNNATVDIDALVAALKPVIEAAIAAEVAKLRVTIAV